MSRGQDLLNLFVIFPPSFFPLFPQHTTQLMATILFWFTVRTTQKNHLYRCEPACPISFSAFTSLAIHLQKQCNQEFRFAYATVAMKTSIVLALVQQASAIVKRHRITTINTSFTTKLRIVCKTSMAVAGRSIATKLFMISAISRSDVSLYRVNSVSGSSILDHEIKPQHVPSSKGGFQ